MRSAALAPSRLFLAVAALACAPERSPPPDHGLAAQDTSARRPPLARPGFALEDVSDSIRRRVAGTDAERLYGPDGYAPVWVDATGKPSQAAREAITALLVAPDEGLDSAAYAAGALVRRADALERDGLPSVQAIAAFDATLSASFLRYLAHLHTGRIDPRAVGFRLEIPAEGHDFAGLVRSSLADGSISRLVRDLRPPLALYRRLRDALARYRELAIRHPAWPALPAVRASVKPGQPYAGLPELARRLAALGDLQASAAAGADSVYGVSAYAEPLISGVKRFQERHGLAPDGVIGAATLAVLNVSPAYRARQIALSLERLRWLPDLGRGRFIVVNIPAFHLWAFDSLGTEGIPSRDMAVIVGRRALNTRTPVLVEELRYLIFRPYWNVPLSIARNEIVPAARRNPSYLDRNDMEIVQGPGDDARAVAETPENLALVASGRLRVRQRPGPGNALGLVKFIFPNDANVYLHGTPATQLFDRARRDFSHGCVRVEDPEGLAEWVLSDVAGWDRSRIEDAMAASESERVHLSAPIPVLLFYTTAIARADGTVAFYEDLYGHDARLLRALGGDD